MLHSAVFPDFDSSHSFLPFFRVLHVFTSNCFSADVPKVKTEYSGFTISWAKILLALAEWEMSHINLPDSRLVLSTCDAHPAHDRTTCLGIRWKRNPADQPGKTQDCRSDHGNTVLSNSSHSARLC